MESQPGPDQRPPETHEMRKQADDIAGYIDAEWRVPDVRNLADDPELQQKMRDDLETAIALEEKERVDKAALAGVPESMKRHYADGLIPGARIERRLPRDIITGIPDRKAFDNSVSRLTERGELPYLSTRSGADTESHKRGFLLADLDKFKPVNDTLGHAAGDRALRLIGEVFTEAVREVEGNEAVAYRIGGDEFGMLPQKGNEEKIINAANATFEKILETPTALTDWDGNEIETKQGPLTTTHLKEIGLGFTAAWADTYAEADSLVFEHKRAKGTGRI